MRCKNCGWDNSERNPRCEKCNAPLEEFTESLYDQDYRSYSPVNANLGKTVSEGNVFGSAKREITPPPPPGRVRDISGTKLEACPKCGYLVRANDKSCPHCGYVFVSEAKPFQAPDKPGKKEFSARHCPSCGKSVPGTANFCPSCGAPTGGKVKPGTVNPWEVIHADNTCTLTMLPVENEQINVSPLQFGGNEIILNRDNTEPENQTITSKEQAVLTYENDNWYITDKSQLKTTYVHAGEKRQLKSGDTVMLGNRRFVFNE